MLVDMRQKVVFLLLGVKVAISILYGMDGRFRIIRLCARFYTQLDAYKNGTFIY